MPDFSGLARFVGIGGNGGNNFQLGTGNELSNLAQVDPEFLGKLYDAQNVRFSDTNPAAAIEEERVASELEASAKVYSSRLRSSQKKTGAFVAAAIARINHGVTLDSQNARLVAAQSRAIGQHSQIAFNNGMNGATASGQVRGFTGENNVFGF